MYILPTYMYGLFRGGSMYKRIDDDDVDEIL